MVTYLSTNKNNISIYLPSLEKVSKIGGKEYFCRRLADCFKKKRVNILSHYVDGCDVSIHNGTIGKKSGKIKILRLDGAYHNTFVKYKSMNKPLKKGLEIADGVIYQSRFSKKLCNKFLGKFNRRHTIINNGFDCKEYDSAKIIPKKFKHVFFTSARWRPHKRLLETIECFLLADIKDSCLYISGDLSDSLIKEKYIKKYN